MVDYIQDFDDDNKRPKWRCCVCTKYLGKQGDGGDFELPIRDQHEATALHFGWYNLGRINEAVRCTPAMAAGITTKVWSMGELLDAALTGEIK